jgi:hypothetical protein
MSKFKKKRSPEQRSPITDGRRWSLIAVSILAAVVIFGAISSLQGEDTEFETLTDRWLRPDGGYILEIRAVEPSGRIDAQYLNPHPINIAKAEAARDGSQLNVFVELRAPNYPGGTYTLVYDREQDQLRGTYFQAALGQRFDVYFVRMK